MQEDAPAYGLWMLAILNSAIFIIFAFSFFKPQTGRDWRSFGAFSAFLVALFAEMYGFPLTIYMLSGWLQSRWPDINWLSHDAGHLPEMMFGWRLNPHFGPFHFLSFVFIGGGFWLISAGWQTALRGPKKARTGDGRHLCQNTSSAICGLHTCYVRLPPAMADDPDTRDVPRPRRDVCEIGKDRGT